MWDCCRAIDPPKCFMGGGHFSPCRNHDNFSGVKKVIIGHRPNFLVSFFSLENTYHSNKIFRNSQKNRQVPQRLKVPILNVPHFPHFLFSAPHPRIRQGGWVIYVCFFFLGHFVAIFACFL